MEILTSITLFPLASGAFTTGQDTAGGEAPDFYLSEVTAFLDI